MLTGGRVETHTDFTVEQRCLAFNSRPSVMCEGGADTESRRWLLFWNDTDSVEHCYIWDRSVSWMLFGFGGGTEDGTDAVWHFFFRLRFYVEKGAPSCRRERSARLKTELAASPVIHVVGRHFQQHLHRILKVLVRHRGARLTNRIAPAQGDIWHYDQLAHTRTHVHAKFSVEA